MPAGYDLNRSVAAQLGVGAEDILVVEQKPGSTFSEARRVIEYAAEHGVEVAASKKYFRYRTLDENVMNYPMRRLPPREADRERDTRRSLVDLLHGLLRLDSTAR